MCAVPPFAGVEYLNKICGCVVYEEDIMQVLAAVESRPIDFIDDYVVWYEVGSGASSHANARFAELLRRDVAGFYEMLYREYGNGRYEKYIKKRHGLSGIYRVKNLYARTFLRFFVNVILFQPCASAGIKCICWQRERWGCWRKRNFGILRNSRWFI